MTAIARRNDPATAHQAADSVQNINETKGCILYLLQDPMTDQELVQRYKEAEHSWLGTPPASESGIRSRRAELVKAGLVFDTGQRRVLPSGRKAIVWGTK